MNHRCQGNEQLFPPVYSDHDTAVVEGIHVGPAVDNRYGISSGHDADPAIVEALHC